MPSLSRESIAPPLPALTGRASVATPGTPSETYERSTWPGLAHLAESLPEAGVHFQGQKVICWRALALTDATQTL